MIREETQKGEMKNRIIGMKYVQSLIALLFVLGCFLKSHASGLEESFRNPPPEARPRTWFHAMSGNMSEEGLTKDLEAMSDAGIGGVILFNVSHFIPKGEVLFNSPEHIRLIAHAAKECERLGLSFGAHNCDGWTSSGGPWITPDLSMKLVVHSETLVDGGRVNVTLPQPSAREGYYKDIAVVAYPALDSEIEDADARPNITSSDPDFDVALASDGRADLTTKLDGSPKKRAWIQFDYGKPHTIRSLHISLIKAISDKGKTYLSTSNDGKEFGEARELKIKRLGKTENAFYEHFDGITARYFRIETEGSFDIMEVDLSAVPRVKNMLARISIYKTLDARLPDLGKVDPANIIPKKDVINVSKLMDAEGRFAGKLPPGKWTVMRFGYTVTGAVNSPASDEGRGLEVDKMSRPAFNVHYNAYVGNIIKATKPLAPTALQYMEIDSYEVGGQNWTQGYELLFAKEHGYDILEFLPLYAGRYIDSPETTDAVLWDVRNFNSKLMTQNYFDYFTELCHADGLISYVEPYSFNAAFNEIDAARKVDIPMGEFWMHERYQTDTAVSAARIYGKTIVSAESFSANPDINWKGHPAEMKRVGDKAWTLGINEFMFHRFAHQANTHVKPGMTMSQWGSHIDRTQTWWDSAGKAWFRYLARGQYLLRRGNPVSDLLVFVGDGSPSLPVHRRYLRKLPEYICSDSTSADALITQVSVKNGKLVLPNGTGYRALVLYNTENIKLESLWKINELSQGGAVIVGEKPKRIGGYGANPKQLAEFDSLVDAIWGRATTVEKQDWEKVVKMSGITPDFSVKGRKQVDFIHKKSATEDIYFFYNPDRQACTFDCTFNIDRGVPELWDPMTGDTRTMLQFEHIDGKTRAAIEMAPEGSMFVVFRIASHNVTPVVVLSDVKKTPDVYLNGFGNVEMHAFENGVYALAFKGGKRRSIMIKDLPPMSAELDQPWQVKFDAFYGFDQTLTFNELTDWKDHPQEEVRHYSGTATYSTSFSLSELFRTPEHVVELDLGKVSVAARVFLNGEEVGTVWKNPYRIDITGYVVSGENQLSIQVANLWSNRLIGDEQYPDTSDYKVKQKMMPKWYAENKPPPGSKRTSFCTYPFYKKNDPLLSSGLLGPVRITISKKVIVQ